jgi:hypothetical protein
VTPPDLSAKPASSVLVAERIWHPFKAVLACHEANDLSAKPASSPIIAERKRLPLQKGSELPERSKPRPDHDDTPNARPSTDRLRSAEARFGQSTRQDIDERTSCANARPSQDRISPFIAQRTAKLEPNGAPPPLREDCGGWRAKERKRCAGRLKCLMRTFYNVDHESCWHT